MNDELRKAKADAWDEAMKAAIATARDFPAEYQDGVSLHAENMTAARIVLTLRALVNPYRSKTDG